MLQIRKQAIQFSLYAMTPANALSICNFDGESGKSQVIELIAALANHLVVVDPHIALARQYIHVRP